MARSDVLNEGVVLGLTLDRYQELMRLPPAAFNGLDKNDEANCFDCANVWKQSDLDALAIAIARAEEMREKELSYHVAPKYINGKKYPYKEPLILDRKHLIEVGSLATIDISLAAAIVLGVETDPNDPVILVVATTVTEEDEICVFYPGEDVAIHPSSVVISGGNVTIQIPRSRLVNPDVDLNCEPPPSYYENDNFITTVDVKRCYTDPSDGAFLVWFGGSSSVFECITDLTEDTQLTYPYIQDYRLAILSLSPATYSGGAWTTARIRYCSYPDSINISYLSGIQQSVQTQLETVRLAHSLLPEIIPDRLDLCAGCWKGDQQRDEDGIITPYGVSIGAVSTWVSDSRSKIGSGGKF